MLFLKLALTNIIRNRRSSLSLTIGIFLSLLLFNALNFNINLVQSEIIKNSVTDEHEIIGHYYFYDNLLSNIVDENDTWFQIEQEPEIKSVTPIASRTLYSHTPPINYIILGIRETDWNKFVEEHDIQVSKGTTNFSSVEYNESHVPVIGYASSPRLTNNSLNISDYEVDSVILDIIGWAFFDTSGTFFENRIEDWMLDTNEFFVFITIITKMNELKYFSLELKIKLNPSMVNIKDIPGTITRLNTLVERLTLKYRDYWFYSPVTTQLLAAQLFVYVFLVITLIFLLPFFFLAFYISKLSSDLNLESRRIQYGVFLTRGINAQTIKRSYFAEGMILGVINGVISFLLTPLFGLLLATYLPVELPQSPIFELSFRYYFDNIAQLGWSILIGVFLGFFIMRIPYFYIRLSPHELMHQYRYEEAETITIRGRRDIAILVLGLYPIVIILLLYLETVLQAPSIFYIITLFLGSYALYVVPFSPFLISYGLSSIFARQSRIILFITNFYTKLFPSLHGLTDRVILTKLYRISRIAFVMSLSLTFIIFPLILAASFENYNDSFREFTLGGDVRIDVNINSNLTLEALRNRPEVASVSLIQIREENVLTLVYMNATDYVSSVDFNSFWNLDQEELISLNESTILVSASIIKVLGLKLGDSLTINSTDFIIVGTFKAIGGTDITIGNIHVVIINQQLVQGSGTGTFILKLKQFTPESIHSLYEYVEKTDEKAKFESNIEIEVETEKESFDIFVFIVRVLETQAVLLSFVAIFALAFLMIIRVRERTREIGSWRSKGMSNKQLMQIMIVETASIGTLGIIIGLITGSILVIGFQGFIINTIIEGTTLIPLELIIPFSMWILLFLLILGTIILAILIGTWATLTPVSQQIRYEDYM